MRRITALGSLQVAAIAFLLGCMFSASASAQTTNTPVATFHKNGTSGSAFGFNGPTEISLQVNRGQNSGGGPSTFLTFSVFTFTAQSFTETFGFGEIPNTALKGDSTAHLTLALDTSQISGFQVSTCTFSFITFTFTCQSGPFGPIQVDWQTTNQFSGKITSTQQFEFFQFMMIENQNSSFSFALSQISYLGTSLSGGGSVGVEHSTSISIFGK